MKNKFTHRIKINPLILHRNCYSENKTRVSDIMSMEWTNIIKDKLDPREIIERQDVWNDHWGFRTYEQTMYIFTEAELKEFIKENVVIKLKDI